jgi:hypothetical protein
MHLGSAQPEACASRVLPPEVLPSGVHGAAITEIVKRTGESLFVSDHSTVLKTSATPGLKYQNRPTAQSP